MNIIQQQWQPLIFLLFVAWLFSSPPYHRFSPHALSLDLQEQPLFAARERLRQALFGDELAMESLMEEWNLILLSSAKQPLPETQPIPISPTSLSPLGFLHDDLTSSFPPHFSPQKIIAQTEMAATILLALAPERVVAVPPRILQRTDLFTIHEEQLSIRPCDPFSLESIEADLALVSHYSDPVTISLLRQKKIPLFTMIQIDSIQEIIEQILRLGYLLKVEEKALRLVRFMENTIRYCDTILTNDSAPLPLYLTYYHTLSLPTKKSALGKLLAHANIDEGIIQDPSLHERCWSLPIDYETIYNLHSDSYLISSIRGVTLPHHSPLTSERVIYLDDDIQQSPSQLIALAYYDLTASILALKSPNRR